MTREEALRQEPITKNDLAQERYQDLKEYFGDKETAKTILEDKKEFKAWLERIKWHVKRADELARELEALKQEPKISLEAYNQVTKERDIAIEQLHELGYEFGEKIEPTTKNDLVVDCISKEAVVDAFGKWCSDDKNLEHPVWFARDIISMPSITPQESKTGHWITKDGKEQGYDIGGVKTWYIQIMCSECGFIKTAIEGHTGQYHYCPNCGAKMVEPQESEDT